MLRRGGEEWNGERKVLSTRTMGRDGWERAMRAIRGMSIRRSVGFVGDSIHTSWVRGIISEKEKNRKEESDTYSGVFPEGIEDAVSRSRNVASKPWFNAANVSEGTAINIVNSDDKGIGAERL